MMSRISLDHAWEAVCAVRDHAARDGFPPVCLCVAAENGEEILLARMDGAPERLVSIVRAKAYTAVRMRCSTREFHERLLAENLSLADFHDPGLTSLPGGIPVMDRDVYQIGEILADAGLDVFMAERPTNIVYFKAKDVPAADRILKICREEKVVFNKSAPDTFRLVTHLDVSAEAALEAASIIAKASRS